jgi:hypothetical protein
MARLDFGAAWTSGAGILPRDLAQDARSIFNMAQLLRIVAPVVCLLMLGSASAQPSNLVRNENGDEGLQFWRVFGNASVADCTTGKCFAINQDAFVYQDVNVSDSATGMFALLIDLTSIEQATPKPLGRPHLHGYFLTGGELRSATLLANLSGQEMENRLDANGEWVKQSGVFRVPAKTGRIRIFLGSGCGKTEPSINCVSHFRKAGIFLFDTEDEAKAFAAAYQ